MDGITKQQRDTLDAIISDCKKLFDAELSEKEMERLNDSLELLAQEDETYRRSLADLKTNSCAEISRTIAAEVERGEQLTEQFTKETFARLLSGKDVTGDELNAAALYIEYLADHARHELRQALIAAYRLKREKERPA